jgi:hypothetical protein
MRKTSLSRRNRLSTRRDFRLWVVADVGNEIYSHEKLTNKIDIHLTPLGSPVITFCTTIINIKKSYVLPTNCISGFWVDPKKKQRLFSYTALTDLFV